jgi:hypothetical protein
VFRDGGRRAGGRDVRLHAIEEDGRWGIARSLKRRDRFPLESLSPPARKRR